MRFPQGILILSDRQCPEEVRDSVVFLPHLAVGRGRGYRQLQWLDQGLQPGTQSHCRYSVLFSLCCFTSRGTEVSRFF